jgi:hypothetical protein
VPCHTDLEKRFADFLDASTDVVRYFKNERLGFSVTYYESNRPRQYYPDFIVVTRDKDGAEVTWLAETKGEIRSNTALSRFAGERGPFVASCGVSVRVNVGWGIIIRIRHSVRLHREWERNRGRGRGSSAIRIDGCVRVH